MLVVISMRMGAPLQKKLSPDDIWQETLLHAWRDRAQCRWDGIGSFRRWLLGIVDHRIRDAVDFFAAAKRESRREERTVRARGDESAWQEELARTTTPSRLAVHREQATQMRHALEQVPKPLREVLRLRLFEGRTMPDVAQQLGIGLSAAKHRYRKGAARYREELFRRLGTHANGADSHGKP